MSDIKQNYLFAFCYYLTFTIGYVIHMIIGAMILHNSTGAKHGPENLWAYCCFGCIWSGICCYYGLTSLKNIITIVIDDTHNKRDFIRNLGAVILLIWGAIIWNNLTDEEKNYYCNIPFYKDLYTYYKATFWLFVSLIALDILLELYIYALVQLETIKLMLKINSNIEQQNNLEQQNNV